jgi:hypothetical protein
VWSSLKSGTLLLESDTRYRTVWHLLETNSGQSTQINRQQSWQMFALHAINMAANGINVYGRMIARAKL